MNQKRIVSKFKQTRSAGTKQKIVGAAEEYFCRNGFYGSSVQKLAGAANVSVGGFYFYFRDKEELLLEVCREQNERFLQAISGALGKTCRYQSDRRAWLREFISDVLAAYGNSGKLRAELKALNYENPRIARQKKQIKDRAVRLMMESIENSPMTGDLRVKHPGIALLFVIDMMDATYDRIESGDWAANREDVVEECVDAIYKYLFLETEAGKAE